MSDLVAIFVAFVFAVSSWLLLELSDRLLGDKK
jgi:hypothetical protein